MLVVILLFASASFGNLHAAGSDAAGSHTTSAKSPPIQSGVYGFSGASVADSPFARAAIGECIWIYDAANKKQVAKGDCDQGKFRVPLKPGHYVIRGPGGNQAVDVKPGGWTKIKSVVHVPRGL
jgi:hypothetical protein